ncbi:predicted protein, partial [Nematostella vectensis]
LMHDKDSGRKTFVEELYEQGARNFPGGEWGGAKIQWTDVGGDQTTSPQEKATPPGWVWASPQWVVDKNRAVDGEGWEYTVDLSYGVYSPVQKAYHLSRRRRWVRRRDLKHPESTKKQFHAKERKMDFVRRRRMMRKLIPEGGGKIDPKKSKLPPILRVQLKSKDAESALLINPRIFVAFQKPHKFQMWAYVYQARDLLAKDESGMNDPYVRVAFANQSQMTEVKQKTLCPTWDQTLIFHVDLFDSLENIQRNPPTVVMELFDKDQVYCRNYCCYRINCCFPPPYRPCYELITTPYNVFMGQHQLNKINIPVLCWGVRNMKKYQLASIKSPSVQFEIGGEIIQSDILTDAKKFPNFGRPILPRKIIILFVVEYCLYWKVVNK